MASKRKAIREAVVTALSGQTAASTRVYSSRATNFWNVTLPAIAVYTRSESLEPQNIGQSPRVRRLQLVIECVVAGKGDSIEGTLDDLIDEVEATIDALDTIGNAHRWDMTGIETDASVDGERVVAVAALTYEFLYIA